METINTTKDIQQRPTTPTPEASGDQGGERMFTQDDVNRIISERLARERQKTEPSAIDEREIQLKARESRLDCRDYLESVVKDGRGAGVLNPGRGSCACWTCWTLPTRTNSRRPLILCWRLARLILSTNR